jgi:NADH:ubiquinone oxidoreductase subunit D
MGVDILRFPKSFAFQCNVNPSNANVRCFFKFITLINKNVIECEPILGYLHKYMEKIGKNLNYLPYVRILEEPIIMK